MSWLVTASAIQGICRLAISLQSINNNTITNNNNMLSTTSSFLSFSSLDAIVLPLSTQFYEKRKEINSLIYKHHRINHYKPLSFASNYINNNNNNSTIRCWFSRQSTINLNTTLSTSALKIQCAYSHISSFKTEGYYKLSQLRDIYISDNCYSLLAVRGGGPGGQGANSSSNKVELRASLSALSNYFDAALIQKLKENEKGKSLTSDESLIVITSHEHRSGHQNKEECLRKLREMIQKASWVPPVEADPIKKPTGIVSAHKEIRRKKSCMKKMQRTARKGMW